MYVSNDVHTFTNIHTYEVGLKTITKKTNKKHYMHTLSKKTGFKCKIPSKDQFISIWNLKH